MTFPAVFNVDTGLTGANGFKLTGDVGLSGGLGYSVASAGDFNGDGKEDLIVGAPWISSNTGAAYIIYGNNSIFANPFNVSLLTGANGFKLITSVANGQFGQSVASAGDFNGDGKADVIVGASGSSSGVEATYVIYGSSSAFANPFNVDSDLTGSNGFKLTSSIVGGEFGWSVASAGDFNGDGKTDVVVGATGASANAGAAYVIYGNSSTFANPFNVDTGLTGANGFKLTTSVANGLFGISVASAGDFNGDGKADVVVGAFNAGAGHGAAYIIYGSGGAFANPFNVDVGLNGTNGFRLIDSLTGGNFGSSVASAGDFNGDGMDDVVVGAYNAGTDNNGTAYVIYGNSSAFANPFNVDAVLNGANGFKLIDGEADGNFGNSVASVGDFNSDGKADIIVGAYEVSSYAGAAYIIYGNSSVFANPFNVSSRLTGSNGFKLTTNIVSGLFGQSVASAGDFNGDGVADIVVGACKASLYTGAAYVIYAESPPPPPPANPPPPQVLSPHQPVPQLTPNPVHMPAPDIAPEPSTLPMFPNLPAHQTPLPPEQEGSSDNDLWIGLGAGLGGAVVVVAASILIYAKINHLWCFSSSSLPSAGGPVWPINDIAAALASTATSTVTTVGETKPLLNEIQR